MMVPEPASTIEKIVDPLAMKISGLLAAGENTMVDLPTIEMENALARRFNLRYGDVPVIRHIDLAVAPDILLSQLLSLNLLEADIEYPDGLIRFQPIQIEHAPIKNIDPNLVAEVKSQHALITGLSTFALHSEQYMDQANRKTLDTQDAKNIFGICLGIRNAMKNYRAFSITFADPTKDLVDYHRQNRFMDLLTDELLPPPFNTQTITIK